MTNPRVLAEYVGFTEEEVYKLCERYHMDFTETARWYDGYSFRRVSHIYSPKSVVDAMLNEEFGSYWTQTETYEVLKVYIEMKFPLPITAPEFIIQLFVRCLPAKDLQTWYFFPERTIRTNRPWLLS